MGIVGLVWAAGAWALDHAVWFVRFVWVSEPPRYASADCFVFLSPRSCDQSGEVLCEPAHVCVVSLGQGLYPIISRGKGAGEQRQEFDRVGAIVGGLMLLPLVLHTGAGVSLSRQRGSKGEEQ